MEHTASLLIENEYGEYLCVSRKTDHNQFGLAGGKGEAGETPIETAIRETYEETGVVISNKKLNPILIRECGGYKSYSYHVMVTKSDIIINHNEPHVVKWGTKEDLLNGPFGEYNKIMFETLSYSK